MTWICDLLLNFKYYAFSKSYQRIIEKEITEIVVISNQNYVDVIVQLIFYNEEIVFLRDNTQLSIFKINILNLSIENLPHRI